MNEQKSQNNFLARGPHLDWPATYCFRGRNSTIIVGLGILVFPFLDGTVHFSSAATVTAARLWGLIHNQWLTFFSCPLEAIWAYLGFCFLFFQFYFLNTFILIILI